MAARRLRKNQNLPQNLYVDTKKGTVYFKYKHPLEGTYHSLGTSRPDAIAAARILNSRLMVEPDRVRSVLGLSNKTLGHLISRYQDEQLPTKEYTPGTHQSWLYWLGRIEKDLGKKLVESFDVEVIAAYLDSNFEKYSYINHRKVLVELFRFAANKGLFPSDRMNPAEVTYAKPVTNKKRQRMNMEQFIALHKAAPHWLQIAMELSLLTLQGRHEILNMRFDDYRNGRINVVRKKVEKHEHSHLSIKSENLEGILTKARESDIASPFIVHRRPERKISSKNREHWTQVLPDYLSKKCSALIDQLPEFQSIPQDERPTFHEIRSLGSHLYKKSGYDNESYVRPLMAHADVKTTEDYQSGHEVSWVSVSADLDISKWIE
jgi:integrase